MLSACPTLTVRCVRRAAEHYRDRFGFLIDGVWGDGYAIVSRGAAVIHFTGPANVAKPGPTPNGPGRAGRAMWDVYLHVEDVAAVFADLTERGAHILGPPTDADHGNREFLARDRDGYVLAFGQDLEAV